ncbi:MAG: GNAT family N-acetyltransferase [Nitrosopumilaceae archaeon]
MKLDEIVIRPTNQPGGFRLADFNQSLAKLVGSAENIPIYAIPHNHDPATDMYALKQDNKFVGYLIGTWGTLNGVALYVKRTYVIPSYRNKGLITALYNTLYTTLKYKLVSDNEMSPESISVWKKLSKTLPVKVLNVKTKEVFDMKDIPDKNIFGLTKDYENIRLILEKEEIVYKEVSLSEGAKRVYDLRIPERGPSRIMGGIFDDYLNYTHKVNRGKYI